MKKILSFLSFVIVGIGLLLCGCDRNYQSFEELSKYTTYPSSVKNIRWDSLPGQILLKWDIPSDSNYYFLQITYYDPLIKKTVARLASIYTDSVIIDNTRARYGDYEFTFQCYNGKKQGGDKFTVKAKSGRAPIVQTITTQKIPLTESQLSTNNQEPTEGPIKNLIDGNANTFFHTRWSSPQMDMPQWIQINLNEPHQNFQFYYQNRNGSQEPPKVVKIQISNDEINWETLATISSGLPSSSKGEYTSEIFKPSHPFTYFRFTVLQTYNDKKYFNLAEFALYDVFINVYDPEAEEEI